MIQTLIINRPLKGMLDKLPAFIERRHSLQIAKLEGRIGYRLMFPSIPEGWIQGWASFDLSNSWKRRGLNVTGVDYFTMGEPANGVSSRFDPAANEYQSWLGGYLVRLNEPREYTLQEHLNLAVIDQINWLRHYGDHRPICELSPSGFVEHGPAEVSGYPGLVYVGGGDSHSDTGSGSQRGWTCLASAFVAMAFNANESAPKWNREIFVPPSGGSAYHDLFLKGYIIIVEIAPAVHAVLYGNGAIFQAPNGRWQNTFDTVKESILRALKDTAIIPVHPPNPR